MEFTPISRDDDSFQKPLTAEQLQSMCATAFNGHAEVQRIREFPAGMFNNTYLIDFSNGSESLILRVGPHPDVTVFSNETLLLRREYTVQPYLTAIADLIPHTIFADFSQQQINRDYVFQSFLPGKLWDEVKESLTPAQSESLWRQLGTLSRRIHATPGETFGFPHPKFQFHRWSEAVIAIARDMYADVLALPINPDGITPYLQSLEQGQALLNKIDRPCLLHGDLWPKNVLIDRQNDEPRIVGLLDSERALWGDPMAEWIYHLLPIPAAYWEGYGSLPQSEDVDFRRWAYLGLYCIQMYLEYWRFKGDDTRARDGLRQATDEMNKFLA